MPFFMKVLVKFSRIHYTQSFIRCKLIKIVLANLHENSIKS